MRIMARYLLTLSAFKYFASVKGRIVLSVICMNPDSPSAFSFGSFRFFALLRHVKRRMPKSGKKVFQWFLPCGSAVRTNDRTIISYLRRGGQFFTKKSFKKQLFLSARSGIPSSGSFFFCWVPRLRLCPFPRFLLFWRIPVPWLFGFSEDILCFFRWVRRSFSRAWNHAHHKTRSLFIFLAKWHLNKIACPDAFILCEIRKRKPRAAEANLAVYLLLLCMSFGACFHVFGFPPNSRES